MIKEVNLLLAGLGIIFYSPRVMAEVAEETDFLTANYLDHKEVLKYVRAGTLVGFGTGTPGDFILRFYDETEQENKSDRTDFPFQLGIVVSDGVFYIRDLYELMDWWGTARKNRRFISTMVSIP